MPTARPAAGIGVVFSHAEEAGFEPAEDLTALSALAGQRFKPLGHPSWSRPFRPRSWPGSAMGTCRRCQGRYATGARYQAVRPRPCAPGGAPCPERDSNPHIHGSEPCDSCRLVYRDIPLRIFSPPCGQDPPEGTGGEPGGVLRKNSPAAADGRCAWNEPARGLEPRTSSLPRKRSAN